MLAAKLLATNLEKPLVETNKTVAVAVGRDRRGYVYVCRGREELRNKVYNIYKENLFYIYILLLSLCLCLCKCAKWSRPHDRATAAKFSL